MNYRYDHRTASKQSDLLQEAVSAFGSGGSGLELLKKLHKMAMSPPAEWDAKEASSLAQNTEKALTALGSVLGAAKKLSAR